MRLLAYGCLSILLPLLTACTTANTDPRVSANDPGAAWVSAFFRDHPLAGKIWQPERRRFVDTGQLIRDARLATYLLIGEKHDNADHHLIQAWLLRRVFRGDRRLTVAFEMFTSDQAEKIRAHLADWPNDAAGLGFAVNWADSGWPDWSYYQPVAQAALDFDSPIAAAGLPRAKVRAIVQQGLSALSAVEIGQGGLDRTLPKARAAIMRAEIIESHCRQLPESMVDPMVQMQTIKDAHMAAVMAGAARSFDVDGAVLIAGGGHVRTDIGVPWHLAFVGSGGRILSVGLLEVRTGDDHPDDYALRMGASDLPYDYVWFTPRVDTRDPCVTHADQLRRLRKPEN